MDADTLTIALINMKGGVGKTSMCHHLTAPLVEMGNTVLLVDLDPQANLTAGLFGAAECQRLPAEKTIAGLFQDHLDPHPDELILPTHIEGVSILPGSIVTQDFDYPRPTQQGEYQFCVRNFLEELHGHYNVILIDCRPSLQLLSWNALLAAEFVLVPFQPEDYGAQGIAHIQAIIDQAIERENRRLRLLGYVLNRVGRRAIHHTFENILRNYYPGDVLKTKIPDSTQFPEAVSNKLPVGLYRKRGKAAAAIRSLAEEVVSRVPLVRAQSPRYLYLGNRTYTDCTVTIPEAQLGKVG